MWKTILRRQGERVYNVHMDLRTNELWSAGLWLERGLSRLPARTYKIDVLVVTPPTSLHLLCTPTLRLTSLQLVFNLDYPRV